MAAETFVVESTLSPEAAFDAVIDLLRVGEWDRGVRDPRLIAGDAGSVGARYEVTVTGFDGAPTTAIYELTIVDRPTTFTMVGTHADFRTDDTVTFQPTSEGCCVTYDASLELLGDEPPMSDVQLAAAFAAIVAVPRAGLDSFLNPSPHQ
jgi:hypothetical protein